MDPPPLADLPFSPAHETRRGLIGPDTALMLDWEKLFKKYVWDDEKTPYFICVGKLTRSQADNELHIYSLFLGILFAVVAFASIVGATPYGPSIGVALYGVSVVCAAVVLAFAKPYPAALYCAAAPAAALAFIFVQGFSPKLVALDHIVIIAILLLLLRYSVRVGAIVRRYPEMAPGEPPRGRRRL